MPAVRLESTGREHAGRIIHEQGPQDATHAVLLLPGGLCSSVWYDDLLAEPALVEASLRFVATTLPGFAGTPPIGDARFEAWAEHAAKLAAELNCDVVVGHSLGANVALEMVATKAFNGPVVLISPALSREDDATFLYALDRGAVVFGHLPFALMLTMIGPAMKKEVPPARRDVLVADLKNNDPRSRRRQMRAYFEYLDRHGSLAKRLCDAGVPAWVSFGEHGDTGLNRGRTPRPRSMPARHSRDHPGDGARVPRPEARPDRRTRPRRRVLARVIDTR
jgi:pimeloyl-ACP methyl ester carboxylesterase